jgi:hypothetical protein
VPALPGRGSWGSIFRVDFPGEDQSTGKANAHSGSGKISIFVLGDQFHAGFDNLIFVDPKTLLAAEDRGDTLHEQLNMLDSVWAYDVRKPNSQGVRFIALGRDAQSEVAGEDNEPAGVFVSDGDATVGAMLGNPINFQDRRIFFTQQHGDNQLWEIQGNGQNSGKKGKRGN